MQPRIIPRSEHPISRSSIDPDALKVLYRLYRSGHTAFLVGGGVRDLLIGRRPKDFDVSTSARPGQVKKLFRNCWLIGRRFRLAHIHFRDHKIVEVATFRAEPERAEGGDDDLLVRQDNTFGTPEEDALRRDFTINGLFYDIASFSLIDYVGGVEDIEAGVIRTIGDPHIRFQEDPVRMIRAIKFGARLDFAIDPETWEAVCERADEIQKCSTSRVLEEIARLMEGGAFCRSVQLLKAGGLLVIVLPEVYEYLTGRPAGPGLAPESRAAEMAPPSEDIEEEILLHADEDVDHEAQERILGAVPAYERDEEDVESELRSDVAGEEFEDEAAPEQPEALEESDALDDGIDQGLVEGDLLFEETLTAMESEDGEAVAVHRTRVEATVELEAGAPGYVADELDEEGEDDEEEILLADDEEGPVSAWLTPEGTRVPPAPDRGALLWRTLAAVDQLIRSGRHLTRPVLFAALFSPILQHTTEWRAAREGGGATPEAYVPELLRSLTTSVVIARRDRERVCQILAAQKKFPRGRHVSVTALSRKPYFAEALDLFEISVLASGQGAEPLKSWRSRFPPIEPPVAVRLTRAPAGELEPREGDRSPGRRRRRGRGGRGRGREAGAREGGMGEVSTHLSQRHERESVGRGGREGSTRSDSRRETPGRLESRREGSMRSDSRREGSGRLEGRRESSGRLESRRGTSAGAGGLRSGRSSRDREDNFRGVGAEYLERSSRHRERVSPYDMSRDENRARERGDGSDLRRRRRRRPPIVNR